MRKWEQFLLDKKAVDITNWDELIPLHDAQEACRIAEVETSEDYKKALKDILYSLKQEGTTVIYSTENEAIDIYEYEKLIA